MDQKMALNMMKSGMNVFLTGQAGSGKTYVLNQYIQWLWDCDVATAITASTGIAATHVGGVTIHSRSGIGIKEVLSEFDIDEISDKQWIRTNITKAKVLIIDEVSMLSAATLDNVERVIQAIKYDHRPWGGMQVIFCGDFFQLPPVSRYGDTKKRFAFASKAWNSSELVFCYLESQHRQKEDDDFTQLLNNLRVGLVSEYALKLLKERMHKELEAESPVRLFTHNVDVDRLNQEELMKLPGATKTYTAGTKGNNKLVQSLLKGMLTPEGLELKMDAHVIFVRNNPALGYWNGMTGIVVGFSDDTGYPRVRVADGSVIYVEPEVWSIENGEAMLASVTQIPLKLAWAITVHKSQGMTLDAAVIDLSKSFECGQSYVALSRVKSLSGLSLLGLNENGLIAHPLVVRGDKYFNKQSDDVVDTHRQLDEDDRGILHKSFVEKVEGTYQSAEDLQKIDRGPKEFKKKKSDTVLKTADLVRQEKTLEEIVTIRGLTDKTVIGHLCKIKNEYPSISLNYLKPDNNVIYRLGRAVEKARKKESNFSEYGKLRLAPLYHAMKKEFSYDEIKLYLIWVDGYS